MIAGKYQVERIIGMGGMGVVAAARHLLLGDQVAIKFLLPRVARDKEVLGRFIQEARASVRIKSEHIVRVMDIGTLDAGSPFIVMEHLEGSDLAQVLQKHGPLPLAEALEYILQACVGIAEAHALSIVHRDLKPSNLFLITRSDGSAIVKVLDFGISKAMVTGGGRHQQPERHRHDRGLRFADVYVARADSKREERRFSNRRLVRRRDAPRAAHGAAALSR